MPSIINGFMHVCMILRRYSLHPNATVLALQLDAGALLAALCQAVRRDRKELPESMEHNVVGERRVGQGLYHPAIGWAQAGVDRLRTLGIIPCRDQDAVIIAGVII